MQGGGVTPSLDHAAVENAHSQAYGNEDTSNMDSRSMGSAAAMQVRTSSSCEVNLSSLYQNFQAFQKFTKGGGGGGAGSGGGQSQLIAMAMGEATKLFNKSGGGASGNKQEVITSAAQTVMKLLMQVGPLKLVIDRLILTRLLLQSKMGAGGAGAGGQGGGIGELLGMVSSTLFCDRSAIVC